MQQVFRRGNLRQPTHQIEMEHSPLAEYTNVLSGLFTFSKEACDCIRVDTYFDDHEPVLLE